MTSAEQDGIGNEKDESHATILPSNGENDKVFFSSLPTAFHFSFKLFGCNGKQYKLQACYIWYIKIMSH